MIGKDVLMPISCFMAIRLLQIDVAAIKLEDVMMLSVENATKAALKNHKTLA